MSSALDLVDVQGARLVLGVDTCHGDPEVSSLEQGADAVRGTVVSDRGGGDACRDVLTVSLRAPLGQRSVVDGSTGRVLVVQQ